MSERTDDWLTAEEIDRVMWMSEEGVNRSKERARFDLKVETIDGIRAMGKPFKTQINQLLKKELGLV
jgi:hypothetical protein